jgi:hypothetical protein
MGQQQLISQILTDAWQLIWLVALHSSRRYIYDAIIVNNLFPLSRAI